ncbi:MAG: glycoside hydrolase family 2 protein, partial [Candidatus Latescibacterota bacterium]
LLHLRLDHTAEANSSERAARILKEDLQKHDPRNSLLYVRAEENGRLLDDTVFLFDKPKNLLLPHPNITCKLERISNGYQLEVQADVFVKNVCLRSQVDGFFSDNYFNLVPGQKKKLIFITEDLLTDANLEIMSLANSQQCPPY